MLCLTQLHKDVYGRVETEYFDNINDLFAQILSLGAAYLVKKSLHKEYIPQNQERKTLKGKLNLPNTINLKIKYSNSISCDYDNLTENNIYNQIIKTAINLLIDNKEVCKQNKDNLRRLLSYFINVDIIAISSISWDMIRYDRNTKTYELLHFICQYIFQSEIPLTKQGNQLIQHYLPDKLFSWLFEHFVLNYYKQTFPCYDVCACEVKWNIIGDKPALLPHMLTDIMIKMPNRTLIIDTKYYSSALVGSHAFGDNSQKIFYILTIYIKYLLM